MTTCCYFDIFNLRKISGRCLLHQLGGGFFVTLNWMRVEIDQSGKIEDTNRDTVIAYANGRTRSVKITGKTKRRLQEVYRLIGKPRLFVISTFSVAIYLLVRNDLKRLTEIVIDEEYSGKEHLIEGWLQKLLGKESGLNITFHRIGKGSKAHELALKVFQGKKKTDETLDFDLISKHKLDK